MLTGDATHQALAHSLELPGSLKNQPIPENKPMRETIKDFVGIAAGSLPILDPVYDFGAFQTPGQEGFANLRPLFTNNRYVGADMREGPGVDVILNLHDIDLPSESVGTVVCVDTLEHVEYPRRALEEIHRVLVPGGLTVISSVMNFEIHDYPNDYWRFTPEAFRSILNPFANSFVGYAGEEIFPHTVVGLGFKGDAPNLDSFKSQYEEWQRQQLQQDQHKPFSIKEAVRSLTPPILLPALSAVYRTVFRPADSAAVK